MNATAGSVVDAQDGACAGKAHLTRGPLPGLLRCATQMFEMPSAWQDSMVADWQKVGIGRLAMREQLAALGRNVEPVRAAIQVLADRSAELQAAVHAEGIQRNMGRAKQGIKRFGLLGQSGLLVGDEETTKKYR